MAVAEVSISIRLAADQDDGHGIDDGAEVIYDDLFYQSGKNVDDVMSSAEDALEEALAKCRLRAGVHP